MLIIRIMGKRQIGELQPFELVVAIIIADLATIPMEDKEMPLINGIIPLITLLVLHVIISYISLKSEIARKVISGTPSIIIKNGVIDYDELHKLRYNLNDLQEQLRLKNVHNIADVEFAILETCGDLSVIPKSNKRPITAEDLGMSLQYEGLSYPLVMDGKINYKSLKELDLDEKWLTNKLKLLGIKEPREALLVTADKDGEILFFQKKN